MVGNDGTDAGSCIGAALFERWAKDEDEARRLLEWGSPLYAMSPCPGSWTNGESLGICLSLWLKPPCRQQSLLYFLNEGIGKVLRFGAYSQEVIDRLDWIKDVLGPTIAKALQLTEELAMY